MDIPCRLSFRSIPGKLGLGRCDIVSGNVIRCVAKLSQLHGEVIEVPRAVVRSGGETQGDACTGGNVVTEGERTVEHGVGAVEATGLGRNLHHFHERGSIVRIDDVTQLHRAGRGAGHSAIVAELQVGKRVGEIRQHQSGHGSAVTLQLGGIFAGVRCRSVVAVDERGVEAGQLGRGPAVVEGQVARTGMSLEVLHPRIIFRNRNKSALGGEAQLGRPVALVTETAVGFHIDIIAAVNVQTCQRNGILVDNDLRAFAKGEAGWAAFHRPGGRIAGIPGDRGRVLANLLDGQTRGRRTNRRHGEVNCGIFAGIPLAADSLHANSVLRTFNKAGNIGLRSILHIQGEIHIVTARHMHFIIADAFHGQPAHIHGVGVNLCRQVFGSLAESIITNKTREVKFDIGKIG